MDTHHLVSSVAIREVASKTGCPVAAREPIDRKHMSAAIDSLLDAGFQVLLQGRRSVSVSAPVDVYQQILGYVPLAPAVVPVVPEKIASEYASLALYLGVFEFEAPTRRA